MSFFAHRHSRSGEGSYKIVYNMGRGRGAQDRDLPDAAGSLRLGWIRQFG